MGRPVGSKNKRAGNGGPIVGFGPDGSAIISVEPATFDNGDATGTSSGDGNDGDGNGTPGASPGSEPRKRRGRPAGSQTKTQREIQADVKGIEALLVSFHGMASFFLKTPELQMSNEEAAMLANGLMNVKKHYPHVEIMDPKQLAWAQLAGIAMGIYGTRFVAITANNRRKKAQSQPQQSEKVVPFKSAMPDGQFPG
jgi:hypothetical protein